MPEQTKPGERPAPGEKPVEEIPASESEVVLAIAKRDDLVDATARVKLDTEVIPLPELDPPMAVRVRALTAGANARIRQMSLVAGREGFDITWAAMEIEQFKEGVIEPSGLTVDQITLFHNTWPAEAFGRVTDWLDKKAGNNKEEMRKAREEFPVQE